jgi:hypothetical protein
VKVLVIGHRAAAKIIALMLGRHHLDAVCEIVDKQNHDAVERTLEDLVSGALNPDALLLPLTLHNLGKLTIVRTIHLGAMKIRLVLYSATDAALASLERLFDAILDKPVAQASLMTAFAKALIPRITDADQLDGAIKELLGQA